MATRRGSLRVYLGASPGVGKTFAMLDEGHRRADRGTDVVVAVVETHGRSQTAARLQGLEIVPRRAIEYRGTTLSEMDVDAVLTRRPDVALVDEYAHTNVPGSRHDKRWQDVDELLDAGIDVITTLNVQHLESLNDVVDQITGTVQRETVPDVIVRGADQIELVDMTPEAIRRRMAHGNIYAAEKIDAALGNYFRPGNLGALRELALLWLADRVDEALHGYRERHGISERWETRERVVVGLTGAPGGDTVIRRASRLAGRLGGELVGVHVAVDDGLQRRAAPALAEQRQLVGELGGEVFEVVGDDPVAALVEFARTSNATQLVLGVSRRSRWHELVHGSFVARLARRATTFDVHVIAVDVAVQQQPTHGRRSETRQRRAVVLSPVRVVVAAVLGLVALPLLTVAMSRARGSVALSSVLLLYLVVVLLVAAIGGRIVGVVAAVAASFLVNWYFVDPIHTFTITAGENVVALVVFVVVAAAVGWLVDIVSRRAREARRARRQADALARSAANLAAEADPLPAMLAQIRATFELAGVRMRTPADPGADASDAIRDVRIGAAHLESHGDGGVVTPGVMRDVRIGAAHLESHGDGGVVTPGVMRDVRIGAAHLESHGGGGVVTPGVMRDVRIGAAHLESHGDGGDVDGTALVAGDVDGAPTLRLALSGPDREPAGEFEVYGRSLTDDEERVLRVLADQLSAALHPRRLAGRAAGAAALTEIDAVRTAMLRAVSHDLRSPLASIKAMVSGLRDPDVQWSPAQLDDALATVEAETDRLDRLVGNLLDASRLQIGELATDARPTPLVEVVQAAVAAVGEPATGVVVQLPAELPLVDADAVLLERAVANVLANACRFNPATGTPVRIDAAVVGDGVHLRIVDHGPGIAPSRRRQVLEPFQRLGDQCSGVGVGLGLSIAQGFVGAMGGRLTFDDTPGGGLIVTIVLRRVPACP
ncbi:MAG: DUF4118 domain-containing protein [Ilumatobacteraceae bacterium]